MNPLHQLRGPLALLLVVALTVAAAAGLWAAIDHDVLRTGVQAATADPEGLLLAASAFLAAFVARAAAWRRTLPTLRLTDALSAVLLSLGANHVLPLRLGEPLRAVSVIRRAGVAPADAIASTVTLRAADLLSLLLLGLLAGPVVVAGLVGGGLAVVAAGLLVVGVAASMVSSRRRRDGHEVRPPDVRAVALTSLAWLLEAVLVLIALGWFGIAISPADALVVLAAAVGVQVIAITPGGVGTYEAAAAAAMIALGVDASQALAAALGMHALKTLLSLVAGGVAVFVPSPPLWGRLRLPRDRAVTLAVDPAPRPDAPIVLFLPAHDEGPRVADVIRRAPAAVGGHPVEVLVVDDGSADDTAARARAAGAEVLSHPRNLGLGAAVRTGLAEAVHRGAAAVAFCDADGEYDPADLASLVGPILADEADYVVGSRFGGHIRHMRPHRRLGNLVLTAWVRWTVREPVTDGQSGYRAFSPAAAASARVAHDYNYAQVLTIDLLAQGARYAEVGIDYRFRRSGRSFIRLGRYLANVVPAVWRVLNPTPTPHMRTFT